MKKFINSFRNLNGTTRGYIYFADHYLKLDLQKHAFGAFFIGAVMFFLVLDYLGFTDLASFGYSGLIVFALGLLIEVVQKIGKGKWDIKDALIMLPFGYFGALVSFLLRLTFYTN